MFEKIAKKLTKGALENVKGTIKEEISKSSDDILPTVVGLASIAMLLFSCIPPQKIAPSTIVVNNYYFGRR